MMGIKELEALVPPTKNQLQKTMQVMMTQMKRVMKKVMEEMMKLKTNSLMHLRMTRKVVPSLRTEGIKEDLMT